MVSKTYQLNALDAEKLISYAVRYRSICTSINKIEDTLTVYTTFAHTDEPTSIADRFQLEIISDAPPKMPKEEHRRRIEGQFPDA